MAALTITPSAYTFFKNSTTGVSSVVGYESSSERGIRYTFKFSSSDRSGGATSYSFSKPNVGALQDGSTARWNWAVSTSSTAYLNTTGAGDGYKNSASGTWTGSATKTLYPDTTYYLFIYPGSTTYGWRYWNYPDSITLTVDGTITYTVSYNKGANGTGTNTTATKTYGTNLTLSGAIFTRTGYTQTGWSTTDGGAQTHALGATYSTNAALTLYPVWTANKVQIAYNPNGGTVSADGYGYNNYGWVAQNGVTYFHTISYGSTSDPYNASTFGLTKIGYQFSGNWFIYNSTDGITSTSFNQSTAYDSTAYYQYSDKTKTTANTKLVSCYLYAGWTANTYSVAYNGNGSTSGSMSNSSHTYDTAKALTANAYKKTGYSFNGWNTKADGTGTAYANQASVKNLTTTNGGTVTLYAQWTINSYTLHVYPQGGTWNSSTSSQDFTLNYGATKSIAVPTRTGYTFGGWSWTTYGTMSNSSFPCSVLSSSSNGISVYNNSSNGSVTHTYVADSSDKPLCSNDHITIAKSSTTASPGLGGFYRPVTPAYSTTYIHTFYAKLPAGYYFTYHNNAQPTGSSFTWLTDNRGTGAWKMYGYKLVTGSSGSTNTFGFIAANSDSGSSTATVTWYLGANQVTKSPTSAQTFTTTAGNTWMYAMWLQNKYTITYNSNDGTGQTATSTHYYDDAKNLTKNPFERPGYEFLGWSTSSDGEVVYSDTESVKNLTSTRDANINLYAAWKPLSQMFIWHNGAWHRALRYVYTTS